MTPYHFYNEKSGNGFTLIETVITVAISIVALIALVNIFLTFNSIYGYQQVFLATAGSASTAMNALEAAVLPADQVITSHSFSGITYTSATTTLVLELPSVDSSGNIISGVKDYVVFYVLMPKLYRITQAGAGSVRVSSTKQLSTTLNSLSFTYDNADFTKVTNVTVDVQTRAQFKQQIVQSHLREQLYPRNL